MCVMVVYLPADVVNDCVLENELDGAKNRMGCTGDPLNATPEFSAQALDRYMMYGEWLVVNP
jgi:hypothetical protein